MRWGFTAVNTLGTVSTRVYRVYKSSSNREPRKQPRKRVVGELEFKILEFASKIAEKFTVSDVVRHFYPSVDKDTRLTLLKRFHDAVKRLVESGDVVKESRGVYRLAKDIDTSVLRVKKNKERSKETDPGVVVSVDGDGNNVVRVHVVGRDVYDFVRAVVFLDKVVRVCKKFVLQDLGRYVGRSGLRRLRKMLSVEVSDVVFGVHGVYGARGYFYRFSEPKRFTAVNRLYAGNAKEIGIDIFVKTPLPKFFVKIYTTSDVDASSRPLIVFAAK